MAWGCAVSTATSAAGCCCGQKTNRSSESFRIRKSTLALHNEQRPSNITKSWNPSTYFVRMVSTKRMLPS
eukprot:1564472-Rhodomonas_salina.4